MAAGEQNRFVAAATGTLNLVVAGCGALAAAALQSVPVAVIGGVAYAALVAWDLIGRAPQRQDPIPNPAGLKDPEARGAALALRRARQELDQVLGDSPRQIRGYMAMSTASVVEMEHRASHLIDRLDRLATYLQTADSKGVRSQLDRLRAQASGSADAEARAQFESAASAREEQLRTLADLQDARDRTSAHLARIVAAYEALPARVVRMRALDAQAADTLSGDVGQELDRMNQEIAAFEQTLESLAQKVPA